MKLILKIYFIVIALMCISFCYYNFTWVLKNNVNFKFRRIYASLMENLHQCEITNKNITDLPLIYVITPTYRRPEQIPELTRLAHTLMLIPNVRWLLVEDSDEKSSKVSDLLIKTGIPFHHLLAKMPDKYRNTTIRKKPKGVSNRNKALDWIRQNAHSGVFYFADDDNTYDLDLFEELRYTKKISMFPVGLVTNLGVSSPVIKNGKFVEFYDGWIGGRKFAVDMAGFAVSVEFLLTRPKAMMPYKPGYEEDGFLKSLEPFEYEDIQFLASNCTKILVWHTQTKKNKPSAPVNSTQFNNTNILKLKEILV